MATLRWSSPNPPDDDVVMFASRLPVDSWRTFASMVRASLAVRRQLRRSPGLVGYTLIADVRRRTLWTASAWRSTEAMSAFVSTEPHRSVMRTYAGRIGTPSFMQWSAPPSDLPDDAASIARALEAVPA
mgnify:CR=1 FL=1